jgi:hypothetical protein
MMKLHELFADPARWTTEVFARDGIGFATQYKSKDAVSFCAIGGLHRLYGEGYEFDCALRALASQLPEARPIYGYSVYLARNAVYDANDGTNGYQRILEAAREADV